MIQRDFNCLHIDELHVHSRSLSKMGKIYCDGELWVVVGGVSWTELNVITF